MPAIDEIRWKALSPWLDRALEMAPKERPGWLAELGRDDPRLAGELAALLEENDALAREGFLEGPSSPPLASLSGQNLGAWTLEAPIGQGGMGSVWSAHRADGRYEGKAAVKLLHMALLGRAGEDRFRREGSILARLAHPHIARLIDAGLSFLGQPYLVLEYVEGEPIDAHCDAQRLDVTARLRLFLDVLAAVGHAHSHLVVHRDLKPSNVLVDRTGQVKLLDFGIAKLLEDESLPGEGTLTREGGRALTPAFAAPEQVLGKPITTATDVYSLGVLLYLLLTGMHPAGEDSLTPAELLRAVVDVQPPRPSAAFASARSRAPAMLADNAARRSATPDRLVRLLRGDLDSIAAKALEKDPQERYSSVAAFADDLRRYLAHEPIGARPASFAYRAARFLRRNRAAVATASAVAAALIATGAFAVWQMIAANAQRRAAEDQASRAEASRSFLERVLADASTSGRPFTTSDLLLSVQAQYGSGESQPAIEQLIHLAMIFANVGENKKAHGLLEEAYELLGEAQRRASKAGYPDLRRQAACQLGRLLHYAGRLEEAAALLDASTAEIQAQTPESPALVDCLVQLADLHLTRGEVGAGVATSARAVALAEKLFNRSPMRQVAARTRLAVAHRLAGDLGLADRTYGEIADLLRSLGRERTFDTLAVTSARGALRSDSGDILGAVKLIRSALDISRAMRPDGAPDQALAFDYGQRLLILDRPDEAQGTFTQARRTAEAEGDANMMTLASIGLAAVARQRGECARAGDLLREAAGFVEGHFPAQHPTRAAMRLEMGLLRLACKSYSQAKAVLEEVVADQARARAPATGHVVARSALAQAELGLGHPEAAAARAAEASAVATRFALPGKPSYWVGYGLLVQAEVDEARGRAASPRELAARSLLQLAPTVGTEHPLARRAAAMAGR
jgi:serine/threonine-protein kinase